MTTDELRTQAALAALTGLASQTHTADETDPEVLATLAWELAEEFVNAAPEESP